VGRPWEYINRSQTLNVEIGTEAAPSPRKGIHKWYFRCSMNAIIILYSYRYTSIEVKDLYVEAYFTHAPSKKGHTVGNGYHIRNRKRGFLQNLCIGWVLHCYQTLLGLRKINKMFAHPSTLTSNTY
jgi:hypothetical protein